MMAKKKKTEKMDLTEAVLVLVDDPNRDRLAAIDAFKRAIKKLLKRGEAVYVEHSATGGKLV
jgi:hypothetical protein